MLLNSTQHRILKVYETLKTLAAKAASKLFALFMALAFNALYNPDPVAAAQTDRIITVIKTLTQDIYGDFVYLSLGFVTTVCIYHLIMIVFKASDERSRNVHVKAIFTAIIAWIIINLFAFFISKIFNLTGQNMPADIFNAGGYGG